ncbi:MAG: hexokinase [Bacteroidales bacterium]|nr:hexokinase [Bacteroidales bacterium]
MRQNYFYLNTTQLVHIASGLVKEIEKGLKQEQDQNDNRPDIPCLPTYINPVFLFPDERVLVLDLGGTNFRAAIVKFENGKVYIEKSAEQELKKQMTLEEGISAEAFFDILTSIIERLGNLDTITKIGYCFSYPCENYKDGDATLLRWTKGVTIKNMEQTKVGKPLMDHLNRKLKTRFTHIKIINDTVAALYAGLIDGKEYDANIGLIVGTGSNMAALYPLSRIEKLKGISKSDAKIAINLESGNYKPGYASVVDDLVDRHSINKNEQLFEKRISGAYLGSVLTHAFPEYDFTYGLEAKDLTFIMSNPDMFKPEIVKVAERIYERSAKLVAAGIAGLIRSIFDHTDFPVEKTIRTVCLVAEGGLFYSQPQKGPGIRKFVAYEEVVKNEVESLLKENALFGNEISKGIKIKIEYTRKINANLYGAAVAAISPSFDAI